MRWHRHRWKLQAVMRLQHGLQLLFRCDCGESKIRFAVGEPEEILQAVEERSEL